jgi:hypothetical protein
VKLARAGWARTLSYETSPILFFEPSKGETPMGRYTEIDTDLLLLAAEDSDRGREEARERIRKMTPEEIRDIRAAMQKLDYLLDDTILKKMAERRPWKL